jgi:hypothetical protein
VLIEGKAIMFTVIARLAHSQDHRLGEAVKPAHQMRRADVLKIPVTDCRLDRLERRVLADALISAQHQGVIDLFARALDAMRGPIHNMRRMIAVDALDVLDPFTRLHRITKADHRRPVEIENPASRPADHPRQPLPFLSPNDRNRPQNTYPGIPQSASDCLREAAGECFLTAAQLLGSRITVYRARVRAAQVGIDDQSICQNSGARISAWVSRSRLPRNIKRLRPERGPVDLTAVR